MMDKPSSAAPMSDEPEVSELEFRPDHEGAFDEIVARFADGMVHVETMSDKGCYVGFYWDDGRYCQWWIGTVLCSKCTKSVTPALTGRGERHRLGC